MSSDIKKILLAVVHRCLITINVSIFHFIAWYFIVHIHLIAEKRLHILHNNAELNANKPKIKNPTVKMIISKNHSRFNFYSYQSFLQDICFIQNFNCKSQIWEWFWNKINYTSAITNSFKVLNLENELFWYGTVWIVMLCMQTESNDKFAKWLHEHKCMQDKAYDLCLSN